jgi:peptidoglycan/LPS O-acetylase OafA/YrhL
MTSDAARVDARHSDTGRVWFAHFLRGPACIVVMLDHYLFLYPTDPHVVSEIGHFATHRAPFKPFYATIFDFDNPLRISIGIVALTQLFLISGFVIPYALSRTPVRAFTIRRVLRLYPTLWACLAVILAVLAVQAHRHGTPFPFGGKAISINASVFAPYFGQLWIEPTMWTLAVEEIFYGVAAVMAWRGVLGDARWLIGVSVISLLIAAVDSPVSHHALYSLEFHVTLLPFVFIGVAMHEVFAGRWSRTRGVAVSAVLFAIWQTALIMGPMGFVAAPYGRSTAIGLLLFAMIAFSRKQLPYNRTIDGLSSISYPVYLLHGVIGYVLLNWMTYHGVDFHLSVIVIASLVITGSVAVHKVVEKPSIEFGRRLSRRFGAPAPDRTA